MPKPKKGPGLGERLGLWERTGQTAPSYDAEALDAEYEGYDFGESEPVEVVTGSADAVDFIGQTYQDNDIDDLTRSIFKVEEIRNTLPNTLPSEVRRTTVISILSSFGLSIEEVLGDAEKRGQILAEVCKQTCEAEKAAEDQLNAEIEELRLQITEKQQQMQNHQQNQTEVADICGKEVDRINELCAFLEGKK